MAVAVRRGGFWASAMSLASYGRAAREQGKIRPVLDFRELNRFVDVYTTEADVCLEKLRSWRRLGNDVYLMDLRKAYLQIAVDRSLWPFQTVRYAGKLYCLTRLGFGLNAAPIIMKSVVDTVLSLDESVSRGASAYVDDVVEDATVVAPEAVEIHFSKHGLQSKGVERIASGARVLGLHVYCLQDGPLRWRRDNATAEVPG